MPILELFSESSTPTPVAHIYVLRLSHYELAILLSALVEAADQIAVDLQSLDGAAFREAAKCGPA